MIILLRPVLSLSQAAVFLLCLTHSLPSSAESTLVFKAGSGAGFIAGSADGIEDDERWFPHVWLGAGIRFQKTLQLDIEGAYAVTLPRFQGPLHAAWGLLTASFLFSDPESWLRFYAVAGFGVGSLRWRVSEDNFPDLGILLMHAGAGVTGRISTSTEWTAELRAMFSPIGDGDAAALFLLIGVRTSFTVAGEN